MRSLLYCVVLMMFSTLTYASGYGQTNQQIQLQGQLQGQTSEAQASNSITIDNSTDPGQPQAMYRYSRPVAAAIAPPLAATGDCLGSASAGGSNSVMGFSLGKTYVDEGCNARMDSRHLWSMGLKDEAVLRLCSQSAMAKVLGDRCPVATNNTTGSNRPYGWM